MVRPKTDAERRYDDAKERLTAFEKDARDAEKIVTGHTAKIATLRRRLSDLERTILQSDSDQNYRANRHAKQGRLAADIKKLEEELLEAQAALSSARDNIRNVAAKASQAGADFTIERDRALLDDAAEKRQMDRERLVLDKRKFAVAEREKLDAAKTQLALAEQQGASAMELERYKAHVHAANLKFEAQQQRELEAFRASNDRALAQLQGQLSERASALHHAQSLEVIDANTLADIKRAEANGRVHRMNVTHEVNEDIRKAWEILTMDTQKGIAEATNKAKLMMLEHRLKKDFETHKTKLAREGRAQDLEGLARDFQDISDWKDDAENEE